MDLFSVAGSQASLPSKNKLYLLRFANLLKTKNDDDPDYEDNIEKELNEGNPIILHRSIPIKGGVNRIRSMQGYPIVALWSEARSVKIYNLEKPLEALKNADIYSKAQRKPKSVIVDPIGNFKYTSEGYGLQWSPHTQGLLASGDVNGNLQFYQSQDENMSGFKKLGNPFTHHVDSIEDIQFCPNNQSGVATCSVDGTVQIIDLREDNRKKSRLTIQAHDCDVNVISWNKINPALLATGADDGCFRVWDLRYPEELPITDITWHEDQIT